MERERERGREREREREIALPGRVTHHTGEKAAINREGKGRERERTQLEGLGEFILNLGMD